jgi:hypothetical protein
MMSRFDFTAKSARHIRNWRASALRECLGRCPEIEGTLGVLASLCQCAGANLTGQFAAAD